MTTLQHDGNLSLFINGEWIEAGNRITEDVLNPATGEAIAALPHATEDDLDAAARAAGAAFPAWRKLPAFERAKIIRKAADLLRERVEPIATRMVMEQGKTIHEARQEVLISADIFDWCADEGRRTYGRVIPSRVPGTQWIVTKEPVGPVAAFTPWNFPAVIPARKISAALACGCTMVIKPSEETPSAVLDLARALHDAGLPNGVLNVVFGVPAIVSKTLIQHPVIRKISFTGSTKIGQELARLAADAGAKRATMELGGHAPVLVFDDANVDHFIQTMVASKYRNAGQVCVSPTRFYIHDRIHDTVVDKFAKAAEALRVGDGLDPSMQMGALANPRRVQAMEQLVENAVSNGASLRAGGSRGSNQGFFYRPTVLSDVTPEMKAMNEEPFGPMALFSRFTSTEDVITEANRLPFGLAAYAFTQSSKTAALLSESIESGMLGINNNFISMTETPFGGVKQSGYGSEGGTEGMDAYLTTKLVSQS